MKRFLKRAHRLYEQERGKPEGFPRPGAYMERFAAWSSGGLESRTCTTLGTTNTVLQHDGLQALRTCDGLGPKCGVRPHENAGWKGARNKDDAPIILRTEESDCSGYITKAEGP